jgi:hypothetical protein
MAGYVDMISMVAEHRKTVTPAGVNDVVAVGTSRFEQIVINSKFAIYSISTVMIVIPVEVDVQQTGFRRSEHVILQVYIGSCFKPYPLAFIYDGKQRF